MLIDLIDGEVVPSLIHEFVTPNKKSKTLTNTIHAWELEGDICELIDLVYGGLRVESAEEKQYFLEEIAHLLRMRINHLPIESGKKPIPMPSDFY